MLQLHMYFRLRNLLPTDYRSVRDIFTDEFLGDGTSYLHLRTAWNTRERDLSLAAVSSSNDLLGFSIVTGNFVEYLATHSHYTKKGIGSRILKSVIHKSRMKKQAIHLYPMSQKKHLIEWYAKHGFRQTTGGYMNLHNYNTRSKASETS